VTARRILAAAAGNVVNDRGSFGAMVEKVLLAIKDETQPGTTEAAANRKNMMRASPPPVSEITSL